MSITCVSPAMATLGGNVCVSMCPCLPGLGLAAAACDFIPGNSENPSDGCDGVVAVVRAWPPDIQNQF